MENHPLLYVGAAKSLVRVQEDQRTPESLSTAMETSAPALSADGTALAFVAYREGHQQIFLSPVDEPEKAKLLFEHPAGASEPSFSSDGKWLTFTSNDNGFSQVFGYNLKENTYENWSRSANHDGSAAWSPDGAGIVFVRDSNQLVTAKAGGLSQKVLLTEEVGWMACPSFAPDGLSLVFMSNRDGNPEIYWMSLAARKPRRLTDNPAYDSHPHISRDGKRILFVSDRSGQPALYAMNLDGSEVLPIAPNLPGNEPIWLR